MDGSATAGKPTTIRITINSRDTSSRGMPAAKGTSPKTGTGATAGTPAAARTSATAGLQHVDANSIKYTSNKMDARSGEMPATAGTSAKARKAAVLQRQQQQGP